MQTDLNGRRPHAQTVHRLSEGFHRAVGVQPLQDGRWISKSLHSPRDPFTITTTDPLRQENLWRGLGRISIESEVLPDSPSVASRSGRAPWSGRPAEVSCGINGGFPKLPWSIGDGR